MTGAPVEAAASRRLPDGLQVLLAFASVTALVLWFGAELRFPLDFDTAYYRGSGIRIGSGGPVLQESIIWTWLGGARTVPHAAFDYWMPLPAFAAGFGYALFGTLASTAYAAAVCAGATAAAVWTTLRRWTARAWTAWLGVLLLAATPDFVRFAADGDSPSYMVAFAAWAFTLLGGVSPEQPTSPASRLQLALAGVCVGLAHLSRGDGLLVLLGAAAGLAWILRKSGPRPVVSALAILFGGWLAVFGPWMLRNLLTFGEAMPPGASAAITIATPDAIYAFFDPPTLLSMGADHVQRALRHGATSVATNLARFVPLPLLAALPFALYALRRHTGAAPWLLTLAAICAFYGTVGAVVGGSQRALLLAGPFAAIALADLAATATRTRPAGPVRRYAAALVPLALLVWSAAWLAGLPAQRQAAIEASDVQARRHEVLADTLSEHFPGQTVMTASHSRVWFGTGAPTVALPTDGLRAVHAAAATAGATLLLLDGYGIEVRRPGVEALHDLFYSRAPTPGITYLGDSGGYRVYRLSVEPPGPSGTR